MDRVGGFLFCCAALYLRHGPAEAASTFAQYVGTARYDNKRYVLPLKLPFRGYRVFRVKKARSGTKQNNTGHFLSFNRECALSPVGHDLLRCGSR